ncbi:membrane protein insertion efficiency factor YidD [Aureivirga marina]|uniref:membrane protein insertion efficiency factor YidD n=1 Tax=Aureivirga marina TaxID=1182451 RepID=UPI0018C9BBF5|nr:membrane protein insertion efficiency factor YidD [Aureivirga marina]
MKYLLLTIIHLYWFLIPKKKRRRCIFKKSCSKIVYEKTKKEGLISGLKILTFRIKNCHPEFDLYFEIKTNELKLITKSGEIISENNIADWLKA